MPEPLTVSEMDHRILDDASRDCGFELSGLV